jgi:hypothetical protein
MLAAPTYDSLVAQLGDAFRTRYANKPMVFATGILLCRPESEFVKKNVLPHIEFLDRISEDYVDYFCIGYTAHSFKGPKPDRSSARTPILGGPSLLPTSSLFRMHSKLTIQLIGSRGDTVETAIF